MPTLAWPWAVVQSGGRWTSGPKPSPTCADDAINKRTRDRSLQQRTSITGNLDLVSFAHASEEWRGALPLDVPFSVDRLTASRAWRQIRVQATPRACRDIDRVKEASALGASTASCWSSPLQGQLSFGIPGLPAARSACDGCVPCSQPSLFDCVGQRRRCHVPLRRRRATVCNHGSCTLSSSAEWYAAVRNRAA